jgi:Phosphotransferase enzyme family
MAECMNAQEAELGAQDLRFDPWVVEIVRRAVGEAKVLGVTALAIDSASGDDSSKAAGYGAPLRIDVQVAGVSRSLVLHTALSNEFGHDRRSDRAAEMLLASDTTALIPRHVKLLDVGAYRANGSTVSLRDTGEFYTLTEYVEGTRYAEDLRRIASAATSTPVDVGRMTELAEYLAELHEGHAGGAPVYTRAIRDLLGSGEGIFGIVDGYPPNAPGAPSARLAQIERRCLDWRWRLKNRAARLTRTHGDFHPFNVLFSKNSELVLLDASRGCAGDPADDVSCMAINYLFFALGHPGAWRGALRELWLGFWESYASRRSDPELLAVCAPFLAWRGLVLSNPIWYPDVSAEDRDRLLCFVERALDAERFEPLLADAVFA